MVVTRRLVQDVHESDSVWPKPGLSLFFKKGIRLYSSMTRAQSRSGMVRLANVPRHSITNSSGLSSLIWAARSPTWSWKRTQEQVGKKHNSPENSVHLSFVCSAGTYQKESLCGSTVLGNVPDRLHHQNVLQLHRTLHQKLQTVAWRGRRRNWDLP